MARLDHVCANVVVWIAKVGIDFNGALALQNGVFELALEVIGPAEKGMRLSRGVQLQRRMIEFDGPIVVALHLRLIGVLQHFPCVRKSLLVHGSLLPLGTHAAYGTKVPEVRKAQLSFLAGVQLSNGAKVTPIYRNM